MMVFMEAETKKHGRPPKIPAQERASLNQNAPHITRRQRDNWYYASIAQSVIETIFQREELVGLGITRQKHGWLLERISILAELGRVLEGAKHNDPSKEAPPAFHIFVDMLLWLGEKKPSAKAAVARLRRWRTGKAPPPSRTALANVIVDAIRAYWQQHPELDPAMVREALAITFEHVQQSLNSEADS